MLGMAAGAGGIDVLPEEGADIKETKAAAGLKAADGIRSGAVAAGGALVSEGLDEGRSAPKEAGVDGVEAGQLFGDLEVIGVSVHLGSVGHIEDGVELFVDHQDGVPFGVLEREEVLTQMVEEGGIEEVIAHGEPEGAFGALGKKEFGGGEDGEAVGGLEVRVVNGPQTETGRGGEVLEGLFEGLVIVAGDDEDFFEVEALEVVEMVGEERSVGQAGEKFVAFGGIEAAAHAGSEDDGGVGMHEGSPGVWEGNQKGERLCFPEVEELLSSREIGDRR